MGLSADDAHQSEVEAWRAERLEGLTRDDGWLSLTGLHWLKEGRSKLGSGADNEVRLPAAVPAFFATVELSAGELRLQLAEGVAATFDGKARQQSILAPDSTGSPTVVEYGSVLFYAIERGERIGLRVKDRAHPALTDFQGLDYFPIDAAWRVLAGFEAYDPPKPVPVPNVLGAVGEQLSPGAVVFEHDGQTYRLDALSGGDDELFLIFGDSTNGEGTYGGGRFLYVPLADAEGRITVDFNLAYNPPCAFTPFATCPLPPLQNKLKVAIAAGEKKYAGSDH